MKFRNISLAIGLILSLSNSPVLAFPDTQNYWAKNCVQQLGERKLITGYPDGSFRPNATVTFGTVEDGRWGEAASSGRLFVSP